MRFSRPIISSQKALITTSPVSSLASIVFGPASDTLQILAEPGKTLLSAAAALIKQQADRTDIPFDTIMEAELLILLMAFITPSVNQWYPGTLHYGHHKSFPFFVRATQQKGFQRLAA